MALRLIKKDEKLVHTGTVEICNDESFEQPNEMSKNNGPVESSKIATKLKRLTYCKYAVNRTSFGT